MNTDPIDGMTKVEIEDACLEILGLVHDKANVSHLFLTAAILAKLKEWWCDVKIFSSGTIYISSTFKQGILIYPNLQVALLCVAEVLGKWTQPQREEPRYWKSPKSPSVYMCENQEDNEWYRARDYIRVQVSPWKE